MSPSQDAIVAIQPHGCGVPLFLVSPGLEAWSLRRLLGDDRPLFGIRLPDLGRVRHLDSLETIAAHCVRSIRKARPQGPYALAGWCASGLLGLEIARQLEGTGARVAFVAMLDARGVLLPPMSGGKRRLVRFCHRMQRFTFFLSRVMAEGPTRVRSAVMSRVPHSTGPTHADAMTAAVRKYKASPWTGRIIHIWASQRPRGVFHDPQFLCGHLSPGGFAFYEIGGNHLSFLSDPHLPELSRVLALELDQSATRPEAEAALA